jgi:hypothetical protein
MEALAHLGKVRTPAEKKKMKSQTSWPEKQNARRGERPVSVMEHLAALEKVNPVFIYLGCSTLGFLIAGK